MNTININRKNISSQEIEQYKDFQSIMAKQPNPSVGAPAKSVWMNFSLSAAAMVVVSSLVWVFVANKSSKNGNEKTIETKSYFISPPMPQSNLPFTKIIFYNTADTIIHFSKNATVAIKKNSLLDSVGNIVPGPIEIKYREFLDPASIFLSGIPMEYDTAGLKQNFESAGMIEISAKSKSKSLYVNPQKPLVVNMQSTKTSRDYNVYQLDTAKRNWVYKGKDKVAQQKRAIEQRSNKSTADRLEPLIDTMKMIQSDIAKIELSRPIQPIIINSKKWHFKIDFLVDEFPELASYKNTLFEIDESYKPLDPKHPKMKWDDVVLEKSFRPLNYYVTFTSCDIKSKYLAYPVFDSKDYGIELKKYESKFLTYQNDLKTRKDKEQQLALELENQKRLIRLDDSLYADKLRNMGDVDMAIRSFIANDFGIWNIDKPFPTASHGIYKPEYWVNDTLYKKTVYFADLNRNRVVRLRPGQSIFYEPKSKNVLWMVTLDSQIAYLDPVSFSQLKGSKINFKKASPESNIWREF
jgi:hypothetical protein